jgi:hypothetical protein
MENMKNLGIVRLVGAMTVAASLSAFASDDAVVISVGDARSQMLEIYRFEDATMIGRASKHCAKQADADGGNVYLATYNQCMSERMDWEVANLSYIERLERTSRHNKRVGTLKGGNICPSTGYKSWSESNYSSSGGTLKSYSCLNGEMTVMTCNSSVSGTSVSSGCTIN